MANPAKEPKSSEITPEETYNNRREFIKNAALYLGTATAIGAGLVQLTSRNRAPADAGAQSLSSLNNTPPPTPPVTPTPTPGTPTTETPKPPEAVVEKPAPKINYDTDEKKNSFAEISGYNNFYEFGTAKSDPAANAHTLKPRPWTITIDGEVGKPQTLDIDALLKWFPLESRVYRMRCVEAWSMVIPWDGFQLADLIKRVEPTSKAKYVAFTTLYDPKQMPGQAEGNLDYPYIEGLRMDEAMSPLTLLAAGIYGKVMPNQMGAPLRLVCPWKYGFKGIKSIVKITFTDREPATTWSRASREYGFYANVNPEVDHPRWTQASERRIGEFTRRKTLMFNGYGEHVAKFYKDMDLTKYF